jgi:hypothetical protein
MLLGDPNFNLGASGTSHRLEPAYLLGIISINVFYLIFKISMSITPFFRQLYFKSEALPARSGADWRAQAQRRQRCRVQHG